MGRVRGWGSGGEGQGSGQGEYARWGGGVVNMRG
jgi:hypothetical protein